MRRHIAFLIEEALNELTGEEDEIRFTKEEKQYLSEDSERIELRKNEYLQRQGEKAHSFYFIEKGILRYWIPDKEDKEVCIHFAFEGEFAGSLLSGSNPAPSSYHIQTLTAVSLWRISLPRLKRLLTHSLNMNQVIRLFRENAYTWQIQRNIHLLTFSPDQHYKFLMEKQRRIIISIPLKYIASYLGIAPQTLSKIRKKDKK